MEGSQHVGLRLNLERPEREFTEDMPRLASEAVGGGPGTRGRGRGRARLIALEGEAAGMGGRLNMDQSVGATGVVSASDGGLLGLSRINADERQRDSDVEDSGAFQDAHLITSTPTHKFKLIQPNCRCDTSKYLYTSRTAQVWNNLPADTTDFSSLSRFIKSLTYQTFDKLCIGKR